MPLPAASKGDISHITDAIAAEDVVFPIPMSPVPIMSNPLSFSDSTISMPLSIESTASSLDMAGPQAMFFVPGPTFLIKSLGSSMSSQATPISTTTTLAPMCLARTFIAAPPWRKLLTICDVTSLGYALTPSSTTPWSAAMVIMAF